MEDKCFECETTEDLQQHHVVPRSRGGTKTVTLCHSCHMKAHGRDSKGLNHVRLTKEGLKRARARGVKLGNPNLKEARLKAIEKRKLQGKETTDRVMPMIETIRQSGITSLRGIARKLNELNFQSPRGGIWYASTVKYHILKRMEVINGRKS